jgi:hypothetical protein
MVTGEPRDTDPALLEMEPVYAAAFGERPPVYCMTLDRARDELMDRVATGAAIAIGQKREAVGVNGYETKSFPSPIEPIAWTRPAMQRSIGLRRAFPARATQRSGCAARTSWQLARLCLPNSAPNRRSSSACSLQSSQRHRLQRKTKAGRPASPAETTLSPLRWSICWRWAASASPTQSRKPSASSKNGSRRMTTMAGPWRRTRTSHGHEKRRKGAKRRSVNNHQELP